LDIWQALNNENVVPPYFSEPIGWLWLRK